MRVKGAPQLTPYKWAPGASGNPAGRPQGARSKLQELTLRFLHKDFAEHGEDVIKRVRDKRPDVYLAAVVSLLPKQAQKIESPFTDLSDEELEHLEQLLAALRAKTVADLARGTEQQSFNTLPKTNGHRSIPKPNNQAVTLNNQAELQERQEQAPSASGDVTLGHAALQQGPSSDPKP